MKAAIKAFSLILVIIMLGSLCACGAKPSEQPAEVTAAPAATPEPAPELTPAPIPTPEPTPTQDVYLPDGSAVTMDGCELENGSVIKDDTLCVRLDEAVAALGADLDMDGETAKFIWRGKDVSLELYENEVNYGDRTAELPLYLMLYKDEPYVALEAFCDALDIGVFIDAEYDHIYCTPGAGAWELPEGYQVSILMYHAVSHSFLGDASLDVYPENIDEELTYMEENGYTPILFEDLAEIEKYEKPVILTFDDGYFNNYDELFPVLKAHNAKATIFMMTGAFADAAVNYLSPEQAKEMADSGLVSIQSHTVNHNYLDWKSDDGLIYELEQSKLDIIRAVGREPFVLAYPCGRSDSRSTAKVMEYYRFGLRMETGGAYVTGSDPYDISRYYVRRNCSMTEYETLISGSRNVYG